MWTVFLFLSVLRLSRCTVGVNYETETVNVGDKVTLSCPRSNYPLYQTQLFWLRLVSGALPEVLGGTSSFESGLVNKTPHWTTKQEPGTFVVILDKTKLNDTGLYFCLEQEQLEATFLKGVFLRIKEPGPDMDTVIKDVSSDPARPGDSKSLQCSVLYDPDSKPCPGGPRVFWFRSGSDESGPSFIYTHGNRSDGCEKSSEAPSLQKCTYSFSESVGSSDEETFYCAVAACGEILLGNGTKIKDEVSGNNTCSTNIAVFVLSAALVICLIVIILLIYTNKTKSSLNTADDSHRNTSTVEADQQSQQRDQRSLIYAAPTFSKKKKKKTGKDEQRNKRRAEDEIIYSGVRSDVTN